MPIRRSRTAPPAILSSYPADLKIWDRNWTSGVSRIWTNLWKATESTGRGLLTRLAAMARDNWPTAEQKERLKVRRARDRGTSSIRSRDSREQGSGSKKRTNRRRTRIFPLFISSRTLGLNVLSPTDSWPALVQQEDDETGGYPLLDRLTAAISIPDYDRIHSSNHQTQRQT